MNEILAYISNNRRRVSVGYELDGKIVRVFRKLDGEDRSAIENAIQELRNRGVREVVLEVFRPNGNSMVLVKKFYLTNGKVNDAKQTATTESPTIGGSPTLFELPLVKTAAKTPEKVSQLQPSKNMDSWKDYALKTEQEKVAKLEAEVKRLSIENRSLDTKVRDFEKEMIKKDHEIEKMHSQVEGKSGLSGFMERASENPKMMDFLAGIGSRLFGMPEVPINALNAAPDQEANPQTEQYIVNIRAWLSKQPPELQEQFYQLVYEITNTQNVSANIIQLINLIKNGTVLKRTA